MNQFYAGSGEIDKPVALRQAAPRIGVFKKKMSKKYVIPTSCDLPGRDPRAIPTSCGHIPKLIPGNFRGYPRIEKQFQVSSFETQAQQPRYIWQTTCATSKKPPHKFHQVHAISRYNEVPRLHQQAKIGLPPQHPQKRRSLPSQIAQHRRNLGALVLGTPRLPLRSRLLKSSE